MPITIYISNTDLTDIGQKRFVLRPEKGKIDSYNLVALSKDKWKGHKGGIKNLGTIINIFNEAHWDLSLANRAKIIAGRLGEAADTHNITREKWRWLTFLIFPLISKIWGCTLFTSYNSDIKVQVKPANEQLKQTEERPSSPPVKRTFVTEQKESSLAQIENQRKQSFEQKVKKFDAKMQELETESKKPVELGSFYEETIQKSSEAISKAEGKIKELEEKVFRLTGGKELEKSKEPEADSKKPVFDSHYSEEAISKTECRIKELEKKIRELGEKVSQLNGGKELEELKEKIDKKREKCQNIQEDIKYVKERKTKLEQLKSRRPASERSFVIKSFMREIELMIILGIKKEKIAEWLSFYSQEYPVLKEFIDIREKQLKLIGELSEPMVEALGGLEVQKIPLVDKSWEEGRSDKNLLKAPVMRAYDKEGNPILILHLFRYSPKSVMKNDTVYCFLKRVGKTWSGSSSINTELTLGCDKPIEDNSPAAKFMLDRISRIMNGKPVGAMEAYSLDKKEMTSSPYLQGKQLEEYRSLPDCNAYERQPAEGTTELCLCRPIGRNLHLASGVKHASGWEKAMAPVSVLEEEEEIEDFGAV